MKKPKRIRIGDYKRLMKKTERLMKSESEKPLKTRDEDLIDECGKTIEFCNEEIAAMKKEQKKQLRRSFSGQENRRFKAAVIAFAVCIIIAGSLLIAHKAKNGVSRPNDGAEHTVETHIADSNIYEKQEIVSAMSVVSSLFSENWRDCRLRSLSYAGDSAIPAARKTGAYGNDYRVMVLNADFTMGEKRTALYGPNTDYTGSEWILVKERGEDWIIRDNVGSELFSPDEIREATDAAIRFFKENWHSCDLYRIGYAGDEAAENVKHYGDFSYKDKVIVLESDFAVGSDAATSLEPGAVYTDWTWILIREDSGDWIVRDWGY